MSAFDPDAPFCRGTLAAEALGWLASIAKEAQRQYLDATIRTGSESDDPSESDTGIPVASGSDSDGPFLTVMVRTQGLRPATLEDALLTLAAQTCDDFEVLVLVHDPGPGTAAAIERSIGQFHERFASRVRVLEVFDGGRARPLNVGIRHARGRYVAMLDDDDIAFAHWVESFKAAADLAPGHVLRVCVADQSVRALPGAWEGTDGYEVQSRPHVNYPLIFDYVDHLLDNRTPNNGYALPRFAIFQLGLGWDESLPVLEDWEHLMRVAAVCGVESVPTIAALLRSWSEGSNSKTVHSMEVWRETHRHIEERHDRAPLLLDRGYAGRLRERVAREEKADREREGLEHRLRHCEAELAAIRSSRSWRVLRVALAPLNAARRARALVRDRASLRARMSLRVRALLRDRLQRERQSVSGQRQPNEGRPKREESVRA